MNWKQKLELIVKNNYNKTVTNDSFTMYVNQKVKDLQNEHKEEFR